MRLFKKITIVGVGLLGGSIGLAIRKKKLSQEVIGYFRNRNKILHAVKKGAIDRGEDNFSEAVKGADLIILCSPISDIIKRLKILKKLKKNTTLITDIGSTKSKIVEASKGLNFIGSHPLAGSEQSGIDYASADLFKGSLCILTADNKKGNRSLLKIAKFWKSLGLKTVIMSSCEHDRILAYSSHLPHAVSFSLISSIPKQAIKYASTGLKDTTRIALSKPKIWVDIFQSNRAEVLKTIISFEKSLQNLKDAISRRDDKRLHSFLNRARNKRKALDQSYDWT